MRPTRIARGALALVGAAITCVAAAKTVPAPTNVEVDWTNPADFSDRQDTIGAANHPRDPEAWLDELADYLRRRAAHVVGADRHLDVTFTDINRAGTYEPWRGPSFDDIRIVTDLYPPRIDLRFTLTDAAGAIVATGTRKLRDPTFLTREPPGRNDPLHYEKRLLDDWLRREFVDTESERH